MCEHYVAAGLPPARFWEITPRLYETEMAGALTLIRRERGLAWEAAYLPWAKKPPSYQEFVGGARPKAEPESFLDMRLRASTKGLRGISMKDAVAAMRRRAA